MSGRGGFRGGGGGDRGGGRGFGAPRGRGGGSFRGGRGGFGGGFDSGPPAEVLGEYLFSELSLVFFQSSRFNLRKELKLRMMLIDDGKWSNV